MHHSMLGAAGHKIAWYACRKTCLISTSTTLASYSIHSFSFFVGQQQHFMVGHPTWIDVTVRARIKAVHASIARNKGRKALWRVWCHTLLLTLWWSWLCWWLWRDRHPSSKYQNIWSFQMQSSCESAGLRTRKKMLRKQKLFSTCERMSCSNGLRLSWWSHSQGFSLDLCAWSLARLIRNTQCCMCA